MKYVENYYPVHYLSISTRAAVPAAGGLSLFVSQVTGGHRLPRGWKVTEAGTSPASGARDFSEGPTLPA